MGFLDKLKTKKRVKLKNLVLIGTVKNREQFDICLSQKFYHIPLRLLIPSQFKSEKQLVRIKYISIYQSINMFKEDSGVKYLGIVESFSVVKRREIRDIPKDSDEMYVLFKISHWQRLNEPIKAQEVGVYPFKIVPFGTYKAAEDTSELFLESATDRELYRLLKNLANDVNAKSFKMGELSFFDENDNLIVFKENQCVLQLPMEVIREMPYAGYETVKESLKG